MVVMPHTSTQGKWRASPRASMIPRGRPPAGTPGSREDATAIEERPRSARRQSLIGRVLPLRRDNPLSISRAPRIQLCPEGRRASAIDGALLATARRGALATQAARRPSLPRRSAGIEGERKRVEGRTIRSLRLGRIGPGGLFWAGRSEAQIVGPISA